MGRAGRALRVILGALAVPVLAGCSGAASTPVLATPPVLVTAPANGGTPISLTPSPFTGYLAPDFTLPDLSGQAVRLADLRGHPVWVNIWATWCVPCRVEMPAMQRLYARYRDQGLVILGVDAQEDTGRIQAYVREGGYSWRFLRDADGAVLRRYYLTGLPSHVFIDRAGVIRALAIGGLEPERMEGPLATILGP